MNILSLLKPKQKKQFVSEINFSINRNRQSHLAIEKLVELRELNVEEDDALKIDYFFYTNSIENAQELNEVLKNMDYTVDSPILKGKNGSFVIKGQTTPVRMMHEVLRKWAMQMCDLGYSHNSDFEGWEIVTASKS